MMPAGIAMRRYIKDGDQPYLAKRIDANRWAVRPRGGGEDQVVSADDFAQRFSRWSIGEIALGPVTSSNIAAVGYDPSTWDLVVQFIGGGLYHFRDVPPGVAGPMLSGNPRFSVGRYFEQTIKPRADLYPYRRVTAPAPPPADDPVAEPDPPQADDQQADDAPDPAALQPGLAALMRDAAEAAAFLGDDEQEA